MEKKELKPAGIFKYFEEICQVPRPSKKEERMIAYLKAFGVKHNLETKVDEAGNVLIKKPALRGKSICKQSLCNRMSTWYARRTIMWNTIS
ncbi:aminoacyl-histidine dipeptidase [Bacteroides pyogenes JCM 10003]|nr:aminoacyl-histidine dipeptidase [Bacteroides pyogenes JCM 10003]